MSKKENTKSQKPQGIIGKIFGWIFGVIFGLAGFGSLVSAQIFPSLILFLMMAILIPPLSNLIKEKMNINLSTWVKIIIIVVGLILVAITTNTDSNTNNTIENQNNANTINDDIIESDNISNTIKSKESNIPEEQNEQVSEYQKLLESYKNLTEQKADITNKYVKEGFYKYADLTIDELKELKILENSINTKLSNYLNSISKNDKNFEYISSELKTSDESINSINNVLSILLIKDVSQKQEDYWLKNETITIKGILGYSFEIDYYLEDSDGYYVLINQKSCIGTNRNPKTGEIYTFEGRLLKNNYDYYRLFCNDEVDTGYYK